MHLNGNRHLKKILAVALLGWAAAWPARAEPPSDESIVRLLAVTKSEAMMESMYANVEQMIRQGMQQATTGKTLTPEQARVMELAPSRMAAVMREEMTWAKLQPMMVQVYRESFDQAEVNGMIEFYQSPLGQSFVAKMPIVMQRSMEASQQQMQSFLPKLQAAMAEVMKEARLAR